MARTAAGDRAKGSGVYERALDRRTIRGADAPAGAAAHPPTEAARIITDNVLPHFEMVPIARKDYTEALRLVGDGGWAGAKIYDALLIGCAAKCGADRIYTFNLGDFRQLAPNLEEKICAP
jgi:predicted nucleic acid-binding protein